MSLFFPSSFVRKEMLNKDFSFIKSEIMIVFFCLYKIWMNLHIFFENLKAIGIY